MKDLLNSKIKIGALAAVMALAPLSTAMAQNSNLNNAPLPTSATVVIPEQSTTSTTVITPDFNPSSSVIKNPNSLYEERYGEFGPDVTPGTATTTTTTVIEAEPVAPNSTLVIDPTGNAPAAIIEPPRNIRPVVVEPVPVRP